MVAIFLVFWMLLCMSSSQERSRKLDASNQVATEYNKGCISIPVDPEPIPMMVADNLLKSKAKISDDKIQLVV